MTRECYSYPGDHSAKQVARLFLYKYARAAPIQGHAVTLAGTDPASEINLLRSYLKWPAHRAWFVDNSTRPEVLIALRHIRMNWPEANVEGNDLGNVVPKLEAIGFANLDFMGAPLHVDTLRCLGEVIPRLLPKAIMGFTWMRGREYIAGNTAAKRLWKLGKGFRGNERRWAGMTRAVDQIAKGSLELIDRWEYLSNHSPMSVAVFRKE